MERVTVWVVTLVTLFVFYLGDMKSPADTHARTFCAYDRVFVEFEERGRTWGTIMLDRNGKPVPCRNDVDEISTTPLSI